MRGFPLAIRGITVLLPALLAMMLFLGGCGKFSELFDAGSMFTHSPKPATGTDVGGETASDVIEPLGAIPEPSPEPAKIPAPVAVRTPQLLPGESRLAPAVDAAAGQVLRDAVLTEDTVWRGEVLVEGSITVAPQTTLTLEPGTIVRFRRTAAGEGAGPVLLVLGRIVAQGSAGEPVRFTSAFADPGAGEWQGIILLGSEKKNIFDRCRVEGAVTGIDASFSTVTLKDVSLSACGTGARFQDSIITVDGGEASGCRVGLELAESEADARNITVRGNRFGMMVRGGGLYMEGGRFVANKQAGLTAFSSRFSIASTIFRDNGTGLTVTDCTGKVTASRVSDNRDVGIHLIRSRVQVNGNEIVSNGAIGLRVEDGLGIAWGNDFSGNGSFDIESAGEEDFRAMANWWGEASPSLDKRLSHSHQEPARGRVLVNPVLKARPPLRSLNSVP